MDNITRDSRTQQLDERHRISVLMPTSGAAAGVSGATSASDTGALRALARTIELAGERSVLAQARPVYRAFAPSTDAPGLIRRPPEFSAA